MMSGSALVYQALSLHEKKKIDKNLSKIIRTGYPVRHHYYLLPLAADNVAAYYCVALFLTFLVTPLVPK